jgi:hypothetical protein
MFNSLEMSPTTRRHPEWRERARAFTSGRVALRDLVLILPILHFISNAYRKVIDHRPIAGSAKSR